jgi:hypothetical protein
VIHLSALVAPSLRAQRCQSSRGIGDKETDRHWEQGEDPSLVDFRLHELRKRRKMEVAESSDRKTWKRFGVRRLMRKSGLSQKAYYAILEGEPVRRQTLAALRRACGDRTSGNLLDASQLSTKKRDTQLC